MTDPTVRTSIRHAVDPSTAARMGSADLRANFHIGDLFEPGRISLTYTHYDRMIVGGAVPLDSELAPGTVRPTGTPGFLDRRELIAFNIGGAGSIRVGDEVHRLERADMLYVGRGASIAFASDSAADPARFYLLSAPAHATLPTRLVRTADARRLDLGSRETSNERSIFQYVHPEGVRTCQLVAGLTRLAPGSVWNTMPCHVHDRRMEVYLYFDLPPTARAFHFLGEPRETRHVLVADGEAVLSPPWSIHSGCGTTNYTFIWAMAGDNVDYTDVDPVALEDLR
jgi:4-deoxy-L-threo-5-hexosulose-uronate ketol-isomerase